ncbi:hypothetical protein Ahy_A03g016569 isoform A [Arachis hypogaea]|uniref:Uncharacterized protein n=1 Tax=Arachis hypogaea TaxID=3818 RepID=A0A445E3W8_ARAHY|nr:hypothetical protein Ahy_A03g016569 isoform A [Arachis hypogaea]
MAESSKNSNIFSNKPHKDHVSSLSNSGSTNNPGQNITSSNPFGSFHHQCWWKKPHYSWNPIIFPTTPYTDHLVSVASGYKKSPNEGHDANNINRLVTDMENYQNGSSSTDPTQLMNQNLETHIINESGTNSQLENPEDEEERKARKGNAVETHDEKKDFPSTKKQCGVVLGNGEEAQKVITRMKNSDAANQNGSSSATLNPTKLNQNLETGINASTGIVRPEIPKEYEEVENKVGSLRDENKESRKELVWLSQKCVDITNENESLLEEMVDKYGEETIAHFPTIFGFGSFQFH